MTDWAARLDSVSPKGSRLRWELRRGISYRAYDQASPASSFCVSTRSAEALFVLEGEVSLELGPRRQHVRARQDEVIVVGRGTAHLCHTQAGTKFLIIDLDRAPTGPEGALVLPGRVVAAALNQLSTELWQPECDVPFDRLHAGIVRLNHAVGCGNPITVEGSHHSRRMHAVKTFLEANYREPLGIAGLAKSFHLDQHYLMRRFKENFGTTPAAYVQFLRTEHFVWEGLKSAARGLMNSTRTALDAGFGDYPTFSRRVHAQFGKPPSRLIIGAL